MSGIQAKGGKKNRKFGRNKKFCEQYEIQGRRLKNKLKKLRKRIRLNELLIKRKAKRNPPRDVKVDVGAIAALKAAE